MYRKVLDPGEGLPSGLPDLRPRCGGIDEDTALFDRLCDKVKASEPELRTGRRTGVRRPVSGVIPVL